METTYLTVGNMLLTSTYMVLHWQEEIYSLLQAVSGDIIITFHIMYGYAPVHKVFNRYVIIYIKYIDNL